jgi:hypothetical protein
VVAKKCDHGACIGQHHAAGQGVQAPSQTKLCPRGTPTLPAAQDRLCSGDQFDEGPVIVHKFEYPDRLVIQKSEQDLCAGPTAASLLGRRPPQLMVCRADADLAVISSNAVACVLVIAQPANVEPSRLCKKDVDRR